MKHRILVVDESIAARIVIQTQLSALGQLVDMASTREELVDRLSSESYDLILISKYFYNLIDSALSLLKKEHSPVIGIMDNTSEPFIKKHHQFCKPFTKEKALKIVDFLTHHRTH